jgi:hypothetical protein
MPFSRDARSLGRMGMKVAFVVGCGVEKPVLLHNASKFRRRRRIVVGANGWE